MKHYIDLTGQRFGKLVVLSFSHTCRRTSGTTQRIWNARCDCGNIIQKSTNRFSRDRSCGCVFYKHGEATNKSKRTSEYKAWNSMKNRCTNIKNDSYPHYGGRGIKVCDRWVDSYNNFLDDIGRKPTPQHSLDRIDVNGNYEPNNCRWATPTEQCNNQQNTRYVDYRGVKLTIRGWADKIGCPIGALQQRLRKYNYCLDDIVNMGKIGTKGVDYSILKTIPLEDLK